MRIDRELGIAEGKARYGIVENEFYTAQEFKKRAALIAVGDEEAIEKFVDRLDSAFQRHHLTQDEYNDIYRMLENL